MGLLDMLLAVYGYDRRYINNLYGICIHSYILFGNKRLKMKPRTLNKTEYNLLSDLLTKKSSIRRDYDRNRYMHRNESLASKIERQRKYKTLINEIEEQIDTLST